VPSSTPARCWCTNSAPWRLLSQRKKSAAPNSNFDKQKSGHFVGRGQASPFALTTQVLGETQWTPGVVRRRRQGLLGQLHKLRRL
jgi:hypothetical protein